MSTSSLEAIGAWRAQRLPLARFGLLALLLAWAAGADTMTAAGALASIVLALSLVAQCRLWDDLVDRERDRRAQPERLLGQRDGANQAEGFDDARRQCPIPGRPG
jgi:hypothetical protein